MPSFKDYYADHGVIAPKLTVGFSYLMALYSSIEKKDGKYVVNLPSGEVEFKDDLPYLEYFANKNTVSDFMSDEKVWGEDLTKYVGFTQAVIENIEKIQKGICLI